MRHFIPVSTVNSDEVVDGFIQYIYRIHGCPDSIVSDRGSAFVSWFWRRLSERLKVTLHPSSAHQPETDGQTEIVNAALGQYLRAFVKFTQDDWVDWLPLAEFAQNNQMSETTGVSPFFANYGFHPRLGIEPPAPIPPMPELAKKEYLRADQIANRFERILTQLKALSRQAQERYEENANDRRDEGPEYKIGDKVMISLEHMETNRPKKKWDDKWDGPFEVLQAYRGAVAVKLPPEIKVNNSFHKSKVRPYQPPQVDGQAFINETERRNVRGRVAVRDKEGNLEDAWEVEKILDVHDEDAADNGLTYQVKWKYHDELTWEPEANMKGSSKLLERFHTRFPSKPGPPGWLLMETNQHGSRQGPRSDDPEQPPGPELPNDQILDAQTTPTRNQSTRRQPPRKVRFNTTVRVMEIGPSLVSRCMSFRRLV
jgi:hypothetical protein